jgi:hypothetical protein
MGNRNNNLHDPHKTGNIKGGRGGGRTKRRTIIGHRVSTEHVQYFTALYFHNHDASDTLTVYNNLFTEMISINQ